jgi:lipoprotein-releasing system permease protein
MVAILTRISWVGMAVVCAALIILLSAFNGIESVIQKMYGKFDADITITHSKRKTFLSSEFNFELLKHDDVSTYSKGIEELVVLQQDKKWANARIVGIEPSYLDMVEYANNTLVEEPTCKTNNTCLYTLLEQQDVFLAPGLVDKLEIRPGQTEFSILAGKRDMKIKQGQEMFKKSKVQCASVFNFNREVNEEVVIWSLKQTQELLGYRNEITHIYIKLKEGTNQDEFKVQLQESIGQNYTVKTNYEKHEMIYKTSQSERLMVLIIMVFVFVFAAINLIASLTIQYIEKHKDVTALMSIGFKKSEIQRVFIFNGMLICLAGLVLGLIIGYTVCIAQQLSGFISMGGLNEGFPIVLKWKDLLFVIFMVMSLGFVFSWATVKIISRAL